MSRFPTFAALCLVSCVYSPQTPETLSDLRDADRSVGDLTDDAERLLLPVPHEGHLAGRGGMTDDDIAAVTPADELAPCSGQAAFRHWQASIDTFVGRVSALLPDASPEATRVFHAVKHVRMCGTRALGGNRPPALGSDQDWMNELRSALRTLHIELTCAIVEAARVKRERAEDSAAQDEAERRAAKPAGSGRGHKSKDATPPAVPPKMELEVTSTPDSDPAPGSAAAGAKEFILPPQG